MGWRQHTFAPGYALSIDNDTLHRANHYAARGFASYCEATWAWGFARRAKKRGTAEFLVRIQRADLPLEPIERMLESGQRPAGRWTSVSELRPKEDGMYFHHRHGVLYRGSTHFLIFSSMADAIMLKLNWPEEIPFDIQTIT